MVSGGKEEPREGQERESQVDAGNLVFTNVPKHSHPTEGPKIANIWEISLCLLLNICSNFCTHFDTSLGAISGSIRGQDQAEMRQYVLGRGTRVPKSRKPLLTKNLTNIKSFKVFVT